jgi:hypothetical protein
MPLFGRDVEEGWVLCFTLSIPLQLYIRAAIAQSVKHWATGWTIGVLGFDSRGGGGLGTFLFTTASRTVLGPTQPPIQWAAGALPLGVKRLGREADHSSQSSTEVKEWVELYPHFPNTPSWRGAQLKHRDNFTFTFTFNLQLYTCNILLLVSRNHPNHPNHPKIK